MEKAHKMQEKKKSISGRKTDKTGKPAIWQLRGRGFYAGNEKEEKNLQSVILDMVNRFGYLGILILIAVENVFPPIPSEVILTFGGFLTTCTRLHPAGVVLASTAGSLLGALVLYGAGTLVSPEGLAELLALPVPPVGGNAPVAAVFAQPETEQHRIRNGARHGFLVHQNDVFLVLPEQPRHCRAGFQAVLEQSAGTQRGIGLRVDREFLVGIRPDEQHAVVDRDLRSLVQIGVRAEQAVVSGIVVHLRRREALEAGVGLRQML